MIDMINGKQYTNLTLSSLQTTTDTFANGAVSSGSTLFAILLLILTETLFASKDVAKFKHGGIHFRLRGERVKLTKTKPAVENQNNPIMTYCDMQITTSHILSAKKYPDLSECMYLQMSKQYLINSLFNPFTPEFLKCAHPSLNFDTHIVAIGV